MTDEADRLFADGLALHRDGLLEQAIARYEQALRHAPRHFDALHHIGIVAWQAADHEVALQFIDAALEVDPRVSAAWGNRANVLKAAGQHEAALEGYARALALDEANADAHYNRGNTLQALERFEEALASYDRALALAPGDAQAWNNRAAVLQELGRPDDALHSCGQALALQPAYAEAHSNRGNVLGMLHRFDEALESLDAAIACQPGFADAWINRGKVLKACGRLDAAEASLAQALALAPDSPAAHWNRALLHLQRGRLEEGWRGYEWRWQAGHLSIARERRSFAQPLWLGGEPLAGKTILLHAEQGLGDTLQMCRYVAMVAARGARVILEVQPALAGLLAQLDGAAAVVARGDPLPPFDLHCPLLSLPLACGTTSATIPGATPYLRADAAKVAQWAAVLGPRSRPRVGLAWGGNPRHQNDRNRSIGFDALAPLLSADVEFVSLQREHRAAEQDALDASAVRQFGKRLHDFSDTAALCELMDLVIAVDTSVAHLAGALGKPLWLLLPTDPDWRWLLERRDSPWYPGARLYRQDPGAGWGPVLERVKTALGAMFEE